VSLEGEVALLRHRLDQLERRLAVEHTHLGADSPRSETVRAQKGA
jgi:hypothetical protein